MTAGLEIAAPQPSTDEVDLAFLQGEDRRRPVAGAEEIRVADLFCGCGGLSLGAREACLDLGREFVAVWAADSDAPSLEVYRRNFQPESDFEKPLEEWLPGDLGEPLSEVENALRARIGELDCVLAGPPCQGHSALNNKTRHDDERNHLYTKVGRFVEIVEPSHVFIENVPTVVLAKDRSIHRTVDHLESLGYQVEEEVVDLSKIGVPQRRKRHTVVASKARRVRLAEWLANNEVKEPRSVRWAIGDLKATAENSLLNTPSRLSEKNLARIDYLFENDCYDLPNPWRPVCHQGGGHTYKSMYGRLSWNELAQTITTGFNSPGQGRYIHPSRRRTLTPREAARLQFIPDGFDFSSVEYRAHLARMIGNAVPPKLSWIVCRELFR